MLNRENYNNILHLWVSLINESIAKSVVKINLIHQDFGQDLQLQAQIISLILIQIQMLLLSIIRVRYKTITYQKAKIKPKINEKHIEENIKRIDDDSIQVAKRRQ